MTFEWNERKNKINRKKHGLSFEEASKVFLDPKRIIRADWEHSTMNEYREITIGRMVDVVIVFVSFTERNGNTRIISARRAEPEEEHEYYEDYDLR